MNVVDGINLEEIREFARSFKMRRLVLGLTQTQVGQALSATEGPAYSQSAICRYEFYLYFIIIILSLVLLVHVRKTRHHATQRFKNPTNSLEMVARC